MWSRAACAKAVIACGSWRSSTMFRPEATSGAERYDRDLADVFRRPWGLGGYVNGGADRPARCAIGGSSRWRRQRGDFVGGHRVLTAAAGMAGKHDVASAALQELRRVQPNISLTWIASDLPM